MPSGVVLIQPFQYPINPLGTSKVATRSTFRSLIRELIDKIFMLWKTGSASLPISRRWLDIHRVWLGTATLGRQGASAQPGIPWVL